MELGRTDLFGHHEYRNAVLRGVDARMVGGRMELWIIAIILILSVLLWRPKKGGKR